MRITFVDTGLSSITGGHNQSRYGREEIGALLVAMCCIQAGHVVQYIRPNTTDIGIVMKCIMDTQPDVVIFFPYTYTKHLADEAAKRLKGKIPVIYGGYHAGVGVMPRIVIAENVADYIIAGRGEHALPWLLNEIEAGHKVGPIVNYKNRSGILLDLPWALRIPELIQDLRTEAVPFMPPEYLGQKPTYCLGLSGSIGCDARCDFCPSWRISPAIRRSPQDVVAEMSALRQQFGPSIFAIYDPLFNSDREWVMELCGLMAKQGPFPSICLPDFRLDREMVVAMKEAGIYLVMMGLEFTSNKIRTARGKRTADPETAFSLCDEIGILTRAFFMLGQKSTTRNKLQEDMRQLHRLPFRADQLRTNFEVPFPGTTTWMNVIPDDIIVPQSEWTTERPVYRTGLTELEWHAVRQELVREYHLGKNQQRHWENKLRLHPELEAPIKEFQKSLDRP